MSYFPNLQISYKSKIRRNLIKHLELLNSSKQASQTCSKD